MNPKDYDIQTKPPQVITAIVDGDGEIYIIDCKPSTKITVNDVIYEIYKMEEMTHHETITEFLKI
jgi:hypothetical protein